MSGPQPEAVAAALAGQAADLDVYAEFVGRTLAAVLPSSMIHISRRPGRFGRVRDDAPIETVDVIVGEHRYRLARVPGDRPRTTVQHVVRQIVLSTTDVDLDVWCRDLAAALTRLSEHDAAVATALRGLTGLGV